MRSCEEGRTSEQQGSALCCRYVVARFAFMRALAWEGETSSCTSLMWAVGTLVDGQQELLGAWLVPSEGGGSLTDVLCELWARGVEHIEWAVLSDHLGPPAVGKAGSPRIGHWQNQSPLMAPNVALSPRTKRVIATSDVVCQRLQASMKRAARRRGGQFESAATAFACLKRQWQRQDRLIVAEHAGQGRGATGPVPQAPTWSVAAGGAATH